MYELFIKILGRFLPCDIGNSTLIESKMCLRIWIGREACSGVPNQDLTKQVRSTYKCKKAKVRQMVKTDADEIKALTQFAMFTV